MQRELNASKKFEKESSQFEVQTVRTEELNFLSSIGELTNFPLCKIFGKRGSAPTRVNFDGLATIIIKVGTKDVGLLIHDFRVNGGSFGIENATRVTQFFKHLSKMKIPAIYISNSSGVRLTDGRKVFEPAFGLLPALKNFAEKNLFISCAVGKCIGLGAVVFGYGHYRIAVRDSGSVNLTGPEIFKMFFGAQESFVEAASPERHFQQTQFVQEIVEDKADALKRVRELLLFSQGVSLQPSKEPVVGFGEQVDRTLVNPSLDRLNDVLLKIGENHLEVFSEMSPVVRTFIVQRENKVYGLFINPPGHPQNMITAHALVRFSAALELFKKMELPIVSILDSPGGDPRLAETDKNFVALYIKVINDIISYDKPKMGIIAGRCFGGASVLGFPKIFGSEKVVAVENSQVGIIHSAIVDQLLESAPRLFSEWQKAKAQQKADLSDLIDEGSIDRLIKTDGLGLEIDLFLDEHEPVRLTAIV